MSPTTYIETCIRMPNYLYLNLYLSILLKNSVNPYKYKVIIFTIINAMHI